MDRRRRQRVLMLLQLLMFRVTVMGMVRRGVMGPQAAPNPAPIPAPLRQRRRPVIQRNRLNPLQLTHEQVLSTYRLDMHTILDLLATIEEEITPQIRIQTAVSPLLKLLCVLHFCASGTFQHTSGLLHGLSQPMFSRILKQVMGAIIRKVDVHIYMPQTAAEMNAMKAAFFTIAGFPQIIGCLDGTHIPIVPPSAHEQAYRNRKMSHSLNVQMMCDSNMCFQHVCARFPGSAHDARILRASSLYAYMEQHAPPRTVILGDSGYPLLPWLFTPLRNPQTTAERDYNAAHVRTRNIVERAFGLLKSRFRCLDRTGGALLYNPSKVGQIVLLCAILHNIAIRRRVPMPDGTDPQAEQDDVDQQQPRLVDANEGRAARDRLIAHFF